MQNFFVFVRFTCLNQRLLCKLFALGRFSFDWIKYCYANFLLFSDSLLVESKITMQTFCTLQIPFWLNQRLLCKLLAFVRFTFGWIKDRYANFLHLACSVLMNQRLICELFAVSWIDDWCANFLHLPYSAFIELKINIQYFCTLSGSVFIWLKVILATTWLWADVGFYKTVDISLFDLS